MIRLTTVFIRITSVVLITKNAVQIITIVL